MKFIGFFLAKFEDSRQLYVFHGYLLLVHVWFEGQPALILAHPVAEDDPKLNQQNQKRIKSGTIESVW